MALYEVRENGKPCDFKHFKVHSSWDRAQYPTLLEAGEYLKNWAGLYFIELRLSEVLELTFQKEYTYNGHDKFTIVKLD